MRDITVSMVRMSLFMVMLTSKVSAQYGVYDFNGRQSHAEVIRGRLYKVDWKDVESKEGIYNWAAFDKQAQSSFGRKDLSIMIRLGHWPPPEWVYERYGIKKINLPRGAYPYCMQKDKDGQYIYPKLVCRYMEAFMTHIQEDWPAAVSDRVVSIQPFLGADGDPPLFQKSSIAGVDLGKYLPVPREQFKEEWSTYKQQVLPMYLEVFRKVNEAHPGQKAIAPLWPIDYLDWATKQNYPFWIKAAGIPQAYNAGSKFDASGRAVYKHIHTRQPDGSYPRCRGESAARNRYAFFEAAPYWNMQYQCFWNLTFGLDAWQVADRDNSDRKRTVPLLTDSTFRPVFEFFNKYAGIREAQHAPGAWIAFHDGLDYADTDRFPESKYGKAEGTNRKRAEKILAEFSNPPGGHGAKVSDWKSIIANKGGKIIHGQITASPDIPDLSWNVWRDNYGLFIRQIDRHTTSYSHFRVGNAKQDLWGRFAAGIGGKDPTRHKIYLDLDDSLWSKKAGDKHSGTIKVVYYDQTLFEETPQKGKSFSVYYDKALGANPGLVATVTKQGGDVWREISFKLDDGAFSNGLERGADLILDSGDDPSAYTKFAFVEIER